MKAISCSSKRLTHAARQFLFADKSISLLTLALLFVLPLVGQQSLSLFITSHQLSYSEAFSFHQAAEATSRVTISKDVFELTQAHIGLPIEIELFDSQTLLATIDRLNYNINGTKTLRARLADDPSGYLLLSITADEVLGTIAIPAKKQRYIIRSENQSNAIYLHKLDRHNLTYLEGSNPLTIGDDFKFNPPINESALDDPKTGNEIVNVDVMIVYTPAAAQWANENEGSILNTIAQAVELGQIALENSGTFMTITLVHSPQLDYVETGNASTDLNNLTYINGVIDEVHDWRDEYGADLVCLFSLEHSTGGLGWLLQNKNGHAGIGFSLVRVQQASWTHTAIHEMGHNMGCHHHKQQTVQPGPTNWQNWPENTWSAGWRWTGNDNGYYCSIMTYGSGQYFPDGIDHVEVPYFSNPDVSYQGVSTGHASNGDNARTLREVRHAIAAYRTAQTTTTPTVLTAEVINITESSASSGGDVIDDGGAAVTGRGVVWHTSPNPSLESNLGFTNDGVGTGTFVSQIENLEPNSLYYLRAYATNAEGTAYGQMIDFITLFGACTPDWEPISNLQYNMQLVAQINIDNEVSLNPNDILGAFVGEECRGIASPLPDNDGLVFLTIGSNQAAGEQVELRIWNSTLCESCDAGPGFAFENQGEIGTFLEPYAVGCITDVDLDLTFGQGYTWFSVNVNPGNMGLNALFTELEPCYDDRVIGQTSFALYTGSIWAGTLNQLNLDRMYRMRLCSQQSITLTGESAPLEPIDLNSGYTWLGYVPQDCLPINEALANLQPAPSYDDRIIGQNTFALFTGTEWVGTLTTLCPGAGYVIRLANPVTLNWPGGDTGDDFNCGTSTITDIDGNVYNTVQIGEQCWMAENLNTTKNPAGVTISRWCYDNNTERCNAYGGLYDWNTMMNGEAGSSSNPSGVQGICPDGWHVPSDEEWGQLIEYMAVQGFPNDPQPSNGAANALKSCRQVDSPLGGECNTTEHPRWDDSYRFGFDEYGFSAFPGGHRDGYHGFYAFGHYGGYWWSASESSTQEAWNRSIYKHVSDVYRFGTTKSYSLSVRCLKNESTSLSLPTVSTSPVSEITSISAISGGYVTDDGGAEVLSRGIAWSLNPNPTIMSNNGITNDGTGLGEFNSFIGNLNNNTTYYIRAYATNAKGTAYGEELNFSTLMNILDGQPCVETPTVTDIDGNIYNTVWIRNKCWMKENLKTTHYSDGTPIEYLGDNNSSWIQDTSGAYAWYNNDVSWKDSYGALYNWYAANNTNGLCPVGWHAPLDGEWVLLMDYGGSYADNGANYKSTRTTPQAHPRWESPNMGATDLYSFSALPGGYRDLNGNYTQIGNMGVWWTSFEYSPTSAFYIWMHHNDIIMGRNIDHKSYGFSMRCIQDYD